MAAGKKTLVGCVGAACAAVLVAFVPHYEGTVLKTYRDPNQALHIITACNGHTGPDLRMGMTFTPAECSELLQGDLVKHAEGVQACVDVPITDGELAAYTSFAFNVGVAAFCNSTAARKLNSGDHPGACAELSKWDKAAGKTLPGLTKRRAAERALCEGKA